MNKLKLEFNKKYSLLKDYVLFLQISFAYIIKILESRIGWHSNENESLRIS